MQGYGLDDRGIRVRFLIGARLFYLFEVYVFLGYDLRVTARTVPDVSRSLLCLEKSGTDCPVMQRHIPAARSDAASHPSSTQ